MRAPARSRIASARARIINRGRKKIAGRVLGLWCSVSTRSTAYRSTDGTGELNGTHRIRKWRYTCGIGILVVTCGAGQDGRLVLDAWLATTSCCRSGRARPAYRQNAQMSIRRRGIIPVYSRNSFTCTTRAASDDDAHAVGRGWQGWSDTAAGVVPPSALQHVVRQQNAAARSWVHMDMGRGGSRTRVALLGMRELRS